MDCNHVVYKHPQASKERAVVRAQRPEMLRAPGQKGDDGGGQWWMASKEQTDCAGEGVQGHALG